jgi:hypothetical protein
LATVAIAHINAPITIAIAGPNRNAKKTSGEFRSVVHNRNNNPEEKRTMIAQARIIIFRLPL